MPDLTTVVVLVPIYNDLEGVRRLLQALAVQDHAGPAEVVLVDNGSQPPVPEGLAAGRFPVRVLRETRSGSYAARNLGIAATTADLLAFTDADCLPDPGWLAAGVQALARDQTADAAGGPVVVFPSQAGRRTSAELFDMAYGFQQESYVKDQNFSVTANLFARRTAFSKVGTFDATLKSGGDREWGDRLHAAGGRMVFVPGAVVRHPARRTLRQLRAQSRRHAGGFEALARSPPQARPPCSPLWRAPLLLARTAKNVAARVPEHKRRSGSLRSALRIAAVDAALQWTRAREVWRLRRGGQPLR